MKIDVYSDMSCPWCRIGKKNLEDALASWTGTEPVEVRFRAFRLNDQLPENGIDFKTFLSGKTGGEAGMRQTVNQVTEAGAAVGVTFQFDQVEYFPNTLLAHRLVALVPEERRTALTAAIMAAYFEHGRNISDAEVLLGIAAAEGHDAAELRTRLTAGEGAEAVDADLNEARKLGIGGVPFFVLNGKFGLSGAHPAASLIQALDQAAQG